MSIWASTDFTGGSVGATVTTATEPIFALKNGAGSLVYGSQIDASVPGQSMQIPASGIVDMQLALGGRTWVRVGYYMKVVSGTQSAAWVHALWRAGATNRFDTTMLFSTPGILRLRGDNASATATVGDLSGEVVNTGDLFYLEFEWQQGVGQKLHIWFPGNNTNTPSQVITGAYTGTGIDNFRLGNITATMGLVVQFAGFRASDGEQIRNTVTPPAVAYNIVGAPTSTGFTVAARTTNVLTGARIKVSTTSDLLTSPVYSSSTMPDGAGYVKMSITGLSPNTLYYWGTELDGTLNTTLQGKAWTLPNPGSQASFTFASSSCHDWTASPAFDNMRARLDSLNAKFFLMLGDLGYAYITAGGTPIAPSNQAQLRLDREIYLEATDPMEFYRNIAFHYTYSDCDGAGANSDGTWPAFVSGDVQAAYRQQIPNPTLPLTDTQARSFVVGRVRVIQTDELTMSSARGATDDASKTKLGTAQKAWFKAEIDAAKAANQVVVWAGDGPWVGGPSVGGTLQEWRAYNTERVELGDYIAAAGVRLIRIHGDTHALAADTGVNNAYGGFPFISAAPFSTTAQVWGLPVSNGFYPATAGAGRQYGEYAITDNGYNLQLAFSGRAWDGAAYVEQVQMTVQWDMRTSLNTMRVVSFRSPTMQYARPR